MTAVPQFPTIGTEKQVNGLVRQLGPPTQVLVDYVADGRAAFGKLDILASATRLLSHPLYQQLALCGFATAVASLHRYQQSPHGHHPRKTTKAGKKDELSYKQIFFRRPLLHRSSRYLGLP